LEQNLYGGVEDVVVELEVFN